MAKKAAPARPKKPSGADIEIGGRIRAVRIDRGMSQEKLAKGLGLSFQQVQKYEKGANRVSTGRAKEIAEIFGISLQELVGVGAADLDGFTFDSESYKLAREFKVLPDHLKSKFRSLFRAIMDGKVKA